MDHTKLGSLIGIAGIGVGIIIALIDWQREDQPDPQLTEQIGVLKAQILSQNELAKVQKGELRFQQHLNFAVLNTQFEALKEIKDRSARLLGLNKFAKSIAPQRDTDHEPTLNLFESLDGFVLSLVNDIAALKKAANDAEQKAKEEAIRKEEAKRKAKEEAERLARIDRANRILHDEVVCRNRNCSSYIIR